MYVLSALLRAEYCLHSPVVFWHGLYAFKHSVVPVCRFAMYSIPWQLHVVLLPITSSVIDQVNPYLTQASDGKTPYVWSVGETVCIIPKCYLT